MPNLEKPNLGKPNLSRHAAALLLAATILPGAAHAECASDADVAAFAEAYGARTPAKALGAGGSMEDALCAQKKLTAALAKTLGEPVGYKVGLTSKPAQERFGVSEPVRGPLFPAMLQTSGATVPVAFGTVPMVEADLLLEIGSEAVNEATTPEEVMAAVRAVRPFIELPDLLLAKGEPLTGETITAMGVGPRTGVQGEAIPVEDARAMTEALGAMTVTLTGGNGDVLAEAPGAAVLGHPAEAVLWLVGQGVVLKPGDVVSVGSFGPLTPSSKTGGGATATYKGLPGDPSVSVTFTD